MKAKLLLVSYLLLLLSCLSYTRFSQTETKASSGSPVHNLNTGLNYTTIQEAINANETLNGQTILVEDGTYYEHVIVNKSLTLVGENRDNTIVDGNGTGSAFTLNANNVSLINFTATNAGFAVVDSRSPAAIWLNETTNCLVENMKTLDSSLVGIVLYGSNQNVISGCECFGNQSSLFQYPNPQEGIVLLTSNENMISNNVVSGNFNGIGLWGYGCNDNVLARNNVSFNVNNGFDIVGFDNNITSNHIWNNANGVLLDHASRTIINDNDISNSTASGVNISLGDANNTISGNTIQTNQWSIFMDWNSGNNNLFYHNNFVGNTFPVSMPLNLLNTWDDGYPSGGNYWSDYNGIDANHDGVGDTLYVIDANNVDHYPLMGHFESFNVSTWSHPNDGFEEVDVISNFTISSLGLYEWLTTPNQYLQAGQLFLRLIPAQGQSMTAGFCRITLPNNILNASYYIVLIDMTPIIVNKLAISNDTHTTLYFTFNTSAIEGIIIVPEFPSFLVLPLFCIATLLTVIIYKKKDVKTSKVRQNLEKTLRRQNL